MKNASDALGRALVVALAFAAGAAAFACKKPTAHAERADDPMRCVSCHTTEVSASMHPPHLGVRPQSCGACHRQTSWGGWRVDHPWWELTGAHLKAAEDEELAGKEKQVKCFWCHRGEPATWKDTKKECVACHDDERETAKPDHATFAATCEDCHTSTAWKPATKHPEPRAPDAGIADAAVDAADAARDAAPARPRPVYVPPRPVPTPTVTPTVTPPKPTTAPTPTPPDVITRPSRRR